MSIYTEKADAIAASLQTLPELQGVRVMVDRQQDIMSELRKIIGKQIGGLVIVTWAGSRNLDEADSDAIAGSDYGVTTFVKPVIRKGETPVYDMIRAIETHLHCWREDPSDHYHDRLVWQSTSPLEVPELLAYLSMFRQADQI